MNRYQKKRHKEIKKMMATDKFGETIYKKARLTWNLMRRLSWCTPCEDCDKLHCPKNRSAIVFCELRR